MSQRSITTVIVLIMLALLACVSTTPPPPGSFAYATFTPAPPPGNGQEGAYAAAQTTLAAGQSEIAALDHQATVVSLGMDQAADAAAQATYDYDQRRLMELSIRATEVSLSMRQAAATQQAIIERDRMAQNATATAQSQAATATAQSQAAEATAWSQEATATHAAYALKVTQTAQARAILEERAAATTQARATLTAYPLTATPAAAAQAYSVRSREQRERRALWDEFVITPVTALLTFTLIVLLIVGGVVAFRRLLPIVAYRMLSPEAERDRDMYPRSLTGVTVVDLDPHDYRLEQSDLSPRHYPQLVIDETPQIEIVDPDEPSVINWIAEAEQHLLPDGHGEP